jgi:hypothetical protein
MTTEELGELKPGTLVLVGTEADRKEVLKRFPKLQVKTLREASTELFVPGASVHDSAIADLISGQGAVTRQMLYQLSLYAPRNTGVNALCARASATISMDNLLTLLGTKIGEV